MVKTIMKDIFFLGQKSEPASREDLQVGRDLQERVIIVNMGMFDVVMFNPVMVRKDTPYETEEGCLSLPGVRKTTRYQNIEVEYYDMNWTKQRQKLSGWQAQICQHELDHLEGILI